MSLVMILAVIFEAFCFLQEEKATKEWYKEDFPKPTIHVEACGRRGKVSWICDPENILSYEAANKIQDMLFSIVKILLQGGATMTNLDFKLALKFFNRMRGIPDLSVEETAERFAKHL